MTIASELPKVLLRGAKHGFAAAGEMLPDQALHIKSTYCQICLEYILPEAPAITRTLYFSPQLSSPGARNGLRLVVCDKIN